MSGSYHGNVLACRRARISLISCTLQSSPEGYGLVSGHSMGGDGNRTGGERFRAYHSYLHFLCGRG